MISGPSEVLPWIHESNLIEDVDDFVADRFSMLAWENLCRHKSLTEETMLACHKDIMDGFWPDIGGRYRNIFVMVGSRECPDPRYVPVLVFEWFKTYSSAKTLENIKQAHIDFEAIHPFRDGNGRTGRMIMNWQRRKIGLGPLLILSEKREDYYQWFREAVHV